jgi:hypothetical protein
MAPLHCWPGRPHRRRSWVMLVGGLPEWRSLLRKEGMIGFSSCRCPGRENKIDDSCSCRRYSCRWLALSSWWHRAAPNAAPLLCSSITHLPPFNACSATPKYAIKVFLLAYTFAFKTPRLFGEKTRQKTFECINLPLAVDSAKFDWSEKMKIVTKSWAYFRNWTNPQLPC